RGLGRLLAAWVKVVAERPRARLWLVGHGPERATLQERINGLGLGHSVALVGRFDEVDVVLAAADAFVLPSIEEDLSVALLEAMAAGLPPVACDNAGNREVVENERQGLLVPPRDTDALAEAIGRLIDQPEQARRLGAVARDRVERHFPLAKTIESHVKLFEGLS
ncbi:MAG TPA: glycosyltransferase, partial [Thermoguttaceae bacterium]|nr:glycosyltransferase [Thermoguttaceae bacterium]